MAMVIADFSGSEAEELRRAMSFHRSEERMDKALANLTAAMTRKMSMKKFRLESYKVFVPLLYMDFRKVMPSASPSSLMQVSG